MEQNVKSLNDLYSIYLTNSYLDDDAMYELKIKIKKLQPLHQHVLLEYVECNSLRKTAQIFHCSQTTISNIIKNIRNEFV